MKTQDVHDLLVAAIRQRLNVLIVGAPGIGKTEVECAAAQEAKALNYVMHPSIGDPTDAKGFPFVVDGQATFLPFDELKQVYDAIEQGLPCALFLDDLGQATPAVQASYMSLMDRIKGKCSVIAATNRRTDRAGVSGLLEPVKSRFHTIVNVETNVDDWSTWAIDNGIAPELIAFLRFRPELLHKFEATQDLVNQPCPRTWTAVNRLIALRLSPACELATIQGAVGEGPAAEFIGFLRIYREMPDLDAILIDPVNADIPHAPNALYAVTVGLASKVTETNFGAIVTYANRLFSGHGEFAVLLVRDCIKRNKKVQHSQAFIHKVASGPIGKLIRGED